nr:MAG TPA: hypothetical protein [Bacteriophage sp.]
MPKMLGRPQVDPPLSVLTVPAQSHGLEKHP